MADTTNEERERRIAVAVSSLASRIVRDDPIVIARVKLELLSLLNSGELDTEIRMRVANGVTSRVSDMVRGLLHQAATVEVEKNTALATFIRKKVREALTDILEGETY